MILRHQPFLAESAKVRGTVTRFAIVDCQLDPTSGTAVLKLALDWVLTERAPGQTFDAMATPWQAAFYKREKGGNTALLAAVDVSAADAVVEERGAEGREFRFHVEVEFELPLDGPLPPLDVTIRRVESVARSPSGDIVGYTDMPDLDPDRGAFAPDVASWLRRVRSQAGSAIVDEWGLLGALPDGPSPLQEPMELARQAGSAIVYDRDPLGALQDGLSPLQEPMKLAPGLPVSLPAARRGATITADDAPKAVEAPQAEPVDAAVFCPPTVGLATRFLVQVFLYPPALAQVARAQAREADAGAERRGVLSLPLDLPRGTRIDLRLEVPGLTVHEPDAALMWRGTLAATQYEVAVPADASLGAAVGRVRFSIAGVPAGTLRFQVTVGAVTSSEGARAAEITVQRYRRAFVSYSSKDRAEVLRRVQAFRIAGLSVFQDVLDLEPGDRWQRELYREIDNCDVVLLFWSRAAAASPWVAKEIDYALELKQGQDDRPPEIAPVPIEGPPIPAPPDKLRHLHFNDALLAHIAAAQATH